LFGAAFTGEAKKLEEIKIAKEKIAIFDLVMRRF
jgi:hypothetical protein